ncbi:hypothetical protein QZH41_010830, partial [Actinostola sp. cb2023]
MANTMKTIGILDKMKAFDEVHDNNPMFKVFHHYMQMVLEMLMFIRAVRTGDWVLHLKALELFTKYFFAHDRLNYARMIPLYLAEMKALPNTDPEIYAEFQNGNWVVNKNPRVAFCALGADHSLEHINRSMKVTGGLVGITLNTSARAKFFLIAPELARLAGQAKDMQYIESDEIHLVFDRYDVPMSLKSATRVRRQGFQDPVYYRITDSTHIGKLQMKTLLSHNNTKMELTEYLARKTLEHAETKGKRLVVAWGSECEATHKDVTHLRSTQEEADTKMLLHAVDAAANGATTITIHSPDTDVFILSLRRYPELCEETYFVTGSGQRHRVIKLRPIVQTIGSAKTAALPALHALSGADNTGSFAGKGKATWWRAFQEADLGIITDLARLGTT